MGVIQNQYHLQRCAMSNKPKVVKTKQPHLDILGRELAEGDFVAAPYHNSMVISKIIRITPKMLRLSKLNTVHKKEFTRYPFECALLPRDDVTFHILRTAK